jgi:hypothetical protein
MNEETKYHVKMLVIGLPLAVLVGFGGAAIGSCAVSHAAAVISHPDDIIQNDDDANLIAAGIPDTFGLDICDYASEGNPQMTACAAGQTPGFTTETAFAAWAATAPKGSVALVDIEQWPASDGEAASYALELHYVALTGQVAKADGVDVIEAPVSSTATMPGLDASAAKWGAWGVDEQIQQSVGNSGYGSRFLGTLADIRKVSKTAKVFAGLSTDSGGVPRTAAELEAAWNSVKADAYGFWLNVPIWTSPPGIGCAVTNGCATVGAAFIKYINGGTS